MKTGIEFALAVALVGPLGACSAAGDVEGTTTSGGTTIGLGNVAAAASSSGSGNATASSSSSGTVSSGSTTGTTSGGSACVGGAPACGDAGLCCPAGWGCANDACCETPCNGSCCNDEQACATVSGVTQCLQTCVESSRCPATAPCCIPTADAGPNVCIQGDVNNGVCICSVASDCSTGCCAPATDTAGNPVGPYVCKPDDGNSYDCCYGTFTTCGSNDCCIKDDVGNEFCASQCSQASDCLDSRCQDYDFSITTTTCSGPTACGPN